MRDEEVAAGPGEVLVETRFSGISRGTEALVLRGGVPKAERARMRAPLQAGSFPFPVKYGYAAVGRVVEGPAELAGRDVFVLHPHQDRFAAPAAMAVPLPEGLPAGRAVLAANMETALNIVWDCGRVGGRPDRGGRRGHGRGADGLALRAAAGDGGDAGRREPGAGGAGGGARLRVRRCRRRRRRTAT